MLLKRQEFREKRDTDTEYENDLFDIRKSVSGAVLFIQKDYTVMLMNSGEVHKDRAVFLNECIQTLQKLLPEFTEGPIQGKGSLMLQPGVWLDEKRRSVWEEEREVPITRKEYEVLHMLFRNKGCVLTYEHSLFGECAPSGRT